MDEGLKRGDGEAPDGPGSIYPENSSPTGYPEDEPKGTFEVDPHQLASYQIRVVHHGHPDLEPPTIAEVEAKVKTAFAELTPGTYATVTAERLDTD